MGLTSLLVHDVTILRPAAATDANGFTVKGATTSASVKGWVTQLTSTEDRNGREAQVSAWRLFCHPDTVILGTDRIQWGSTVFEVDGAAQHAWTPRGEHHVEVPLRVVDG